MRPTAMPYPPVEMHQNADIETVETMCTSSLRQPRLIYNILPTVTVIEAYRN